MSHFSVLVITDTPDGLSEALQPFHEFECTGDDDQYIVDVDETEEFVSSYNEDTRSMMRHTDGTLSPAYDDRFYREPTAAEPKMAGSGCGGGISWTSKDWGDGRGYRAKVHFVPDGWEEVDVPVRESMTIREFAEYNSEHVADKESDIDVSGEHKYGHVLMDGDKLVRKIRRTNPNKQWDWWALGGRMSGRLKIKPEYSTGSGRKGKPGLMGAQYDEKGYDQAKKRTIDWDSMANEKCRRRRDQIEEALVKVGNATGKSRECLLGLHAEASALWSAVDSAWKALSKKNNTR